MHGVAESFKLPLENPVLIFALVLFIILFGPLVLNRLRIPPIIGLIIAGAVIGPNGFQVLSRDASIVLFGTVGLLYIMFLAGLEIDMQEFRKNKYRSLVFGLLTFLIPMGAGALAGVYVLDFSLNTALLVASMFASHTLIAYPIASRFGLTKNRSVNITVGGTIIADTLALLVLAVVVDSVKGELDQSFWIRLGVSLAVFAAVVMGLFPLLARWFFKNESDSISQYIFVLGLVFLSAFLAELAGVEPIIGAFAAGVALNRLIPRTSPLMNRVEFVGNALFIPFFLIGVGMLVDFRVFIQNVDTINVALVMTVVATLTKLAPAWFAKLAFGFTRDEFLMMFGLSNARVGAALAASLVGYRTIVETLPDGTPVRLIGEQVLSGTIVMILITCTISSFVVARAGGRMAVLETERKEGAGDDDSTARILVSLAEAENIEPFIDLAVSFKPKKSRERIYALHVVDEQRTQDGAHGRKLLEQAVKFAAASDNVVEPIVRHDLNVASGLNFSLREHNITDVVMGLTREGWQASAMFGPLTASVLERSHKSVYVYGPLQPLGTIKRILVVVPMRAEFEAGFVRWFERVKALGQQTGAMLSFHGPAATLQPLRTLCEKAGLHEATFEILDDWDDFLIIGRDLGGDDLLVVVAARPNSLSYDPLMDKLPRQLGRYFTANGFLVVFPEQLGEETFERPDLDPSMVDVLEGGVKGLETTGRYVRRFLRGQK